MSFLSSNTKEARSISYPFGDHYIQMSGKMIASCSGYYLYQVTIQHIEIEQNMSDQKKASYLQKLFYMCNDVAVINYSDDTVTSLKSSLSSQPIGRESVISGIAGVMEEWGKNWLYPPDYKRFTGLSGLKKGKKMTEKMKGSLALLLASVICGSGFVTAKIGSGTMSFFSFNGMRFLVAILILLPFVIRNITQTRYFSQKENGYELARTRRIRTAAGSLVCGILLAGGINLQQAGLGLCSAGRSGFITILYVIIVPVMGVVEGKRPGLRLCFLRPLASPSRQLDRKRFPLQLHLLS